MRSASGESCLAAWSKWRASGVSKVRKLTLDALEPTLRRGVSELDLGEVEIADGSLERACRRCGVEAIGRETAFRRRVVGILSIIDVCGADRMVAIDRLDALPHTRDAGAGTRVALGDVRVSVRRRQSRPSAGGVTVRADSPGTLPSSRGELVETERILEIEVVARGQGPCPCPCCSLSDRSCATVGVKLGGFVAIIGRGHSLLRPFLVGIIAALDRVCLGKVEVAGQNWSAGAERQAVLGKGRRVIKRKGTQMTERVIALGAEFAVELGWVTSEEGAQRTTTTWTRWPSFDPWTCCDGERGYCDGAWLSLDELLDVELSARGVDAFSEASSISSSVGSAMEVLPGLRTEDALPPTDCDLFPLRLALRMSRRMKEPPDFACDEREAEGLGRAAASDDFALCTLALGAADGGAVVLQRKRHGHGGRRRDGARCIGGRDGGTRVGALTHGRMHRFEAGVEIGVDREVAQRRGGCRCRSHLHDRGSWLCPSWRGGWADISARGRCWSKTGVGVVICAWLVTRGRLAVDRSAATLFSRHDVVLLRMLGAVGIGACHGHRAAVRSSGERTEGAAVGSELGCWSVGGLGAAVGHDEGEARGTHVGVAE
ncbi:hypothetical protein L1887_56627 [Cichorium endivia]|nr:hypothetical protein L1887_56627 [Cichorium endivia]